MFSTAKYAKYAKTGSWQGTRLNFSPISRISVRQESLVDRANPMGCAM
jgi:hypothetical protein